MLAIRAEDNFKAVTQNHNEFAICPQRLNFQKVCELKLLLNSSSISGELNLPHRYIHLQKTNQVYFQAFVQLEEGSQLELVEQLSTPKNYTVGVITATRTYRSQHTIVCANGLSRYLLNKTGVKVDVYCTHIQLIMTLCVYIKLRTFVMPAILKRLTANSEINNYQWYRFRSDIITEEYNFLKLIFI
ncbi:hypothetical protein [cyanobacterium endosymbiont of Rhopalodia gibberula]|uniref:hypothetical protein n=1 Tax=cyanobacterium endosymbiont of Rhopalodia gibberula TaxID=1763363 RepID=UPI000E646D61|nr:hypothetical protein [cyanobacterium endosymbiont of Rhopalodia gibberula]